MILLSMLLVLVGAVTLVIGFFSPQSPGFIYATIVASLLAAVFLVLAIVRQRPGAKRPALLAGAGLESASAFGIGGFWGREKGEIGTLDRDDTEFGGMEDSYEDPTATGFDDDDLGALDDSEFDETDYDELGTDEDADWWAPEADDEDEDDGHETAHLAIVTPIWDEPDEQTTSEQEAALFERTADPADSPSADRETERFLEALRPVRGVGPSKQSELLAHFKTLRRLRNASVDKIAEVPGISTTLAERIYAELHNEVA